MMTRGLNLKAKAATLAMRLAGNRRGNVAMLFALCLPVLLMLTAAGVDIHRISTVQSNLQDALDAAALAAARSPHTDDADIRRVGLDALRANLYAYPRIQLLEGSVTFALNDLGVVVADADVNVDTLIANLVMAPHGRFFDDQTTVRAHSEVMRSNMRIEVALVIDNTGSMTSDGKLTATQAAAISLVNRLEAAADRSVEDDAVRISLVPFSSTVRINSGFGSTTNRTQASALPYLSQATNHTGSTGTYGIFETGQNRFQLYDNMRVGWAGCVESRAYPYDTRDTAPSSSNQATMFVPMLAPDLPDQTGSGGYPNDTTWRAYATAFSGSAFYNNYLSDGRTGSSNSRPFASTTAREAEWNTRLRNPAKYNTTSVTTANGYGPNYGCGIQPLVRLTTNFSQVRTNIQNMVAHGTTNIPMGLMWGWHTISPNAPFSDAKPYGEERLQKIVILMTDGDNTNYDFAVPDRSSYSGIGLIWQDRIGVGRGTTDNQRRTALDNRLAELCNNLRGQEVLVYTVGVGVDNRTQVLLGDCATDDDMFFNVSGASGIASAFDRIAGAIENLRISK